MRETLRRARQIAADEGTPLDTSHLLLALMEIDGYDTASRMLALYGLTPGRVRMRWSAGEPHGAVTAVLKKGFSFAASFKTEARPLHLLAALASVRGTIARHAFDLLGIDGAVIRTAALRCLVGPPEPPRPEPASDEAERVDAP